MDDSQIEHVGMFVKVKTFLNKKTSELASTPVIAATLQPAFIAKIDEILAEEEDASAPITGSTELKRNLRTDAEDKGFEVAAACVAYYTITVPNPVLRKKCEFQRSDLQPPNTRDSDLYIKMKRVHTIAEPIKALLAPFGVVAADVDALDTALAAYFIQLEAPFDARGERQASGEQVDRLFVQAMELLTEQLDVVMKFYVTNNPELHDYYLHARSIDQTGGGPIPDEDETITIASATFTGDTFSPEVNENSRYVITSGASNGAQLNIGFSNMLGMFSGPFKTVDPGTTLDEKAVDLGYIAGTTNFIVLQNTGSPNPVSITVRGKVFY